MGIWQRITGLLQREHGTNVVVVDDSQPIIEEQQLWLQFQRIGGNLTPQQVSRIIIEADGGRIANFVDLCNEARQKDGHLHAVLQTRELALKGLEWSIAPPEDASQPEADAARACERAIRGAENFPNLLHHLNSAGPYHGHATAETMWTRMGRLVVPERWKVVHPRRFLFALRDGSLLFSDDGNEFAAVDLVEEHPGKFVQHMPVVNGDVRVREGLARVLIWLALFRNWDLRDWLQLGEIGWKPWRIGYYDRNADQQSDRRDINILKRAVRTLGTTGAATLPETTKLQVEWPKGTGSSTSTSSHKELFNEMGSEMSKAVLGQTLSTEQGNRGSQALGKVQNAVRGDILVADAVGVAATLTRHLVRPFYLLNSSPSVRPGHLIFHTEDSVELTEFSKAIKTLVDAGLRIPAAWVRNQGGPIPEPQQGEEVIGETSGQQKEEQQES